MYASGGCQPVASAARRSGSAGLCARDAVLDHERALGVTGSSGSSTLVMKRRSNCIGPLVTLAVK